MGENDLVERLLSGDRRALARIISRIEDEDPEVRDMISELYPHTGGAITVGFTGPPGVGKSSIIARLIELYREEDKKVGVVSVDPSSPFTKGAILGDRIRLGDHFLDKAVFIRSMGTRGHLGGLAGASQLAGLAMEAYGMDVVLYETVGVGQGEVGAASEVRSILEIGHELDPDAPMPPIVMTRGDNGEGVEELKEKIGEHRKFLRESDRMKERHLTSIKDFVLS